MPHIDDFWDDIVDDGLVDPDQGGRARARFIQVGGGLDTAVLENASLDPEARQTLLETAAQALGRKLAGPMALAEPDAEAARHIPRNIVDRYGVMPARDERGRLILITPPLAPHVFNELKSRLGRSFDVRLALEIDIRLALARHFDVPLPSRFEVLRSGRLPGRSALSGVTARRPAPKPKGVAALMPTPAAPAAPAPRKPSGNQTRSWLTEASGKLRHAREKEALFQLLADAGALALSGRFYLLRVSEDRIRCVAGTGLHAGNGPTIALHRDSRIDHALRIGSSRLEDWSHDPDLTALYTALGRARPARVMIEPIRDGLEVVGVFVGDHGRAGIDRGVVGELRRWLSRISTRLADLRESQAPEPVPPPMVEAPAHEAPPPPPRVSPPPPPAADGRAPMPSADPFSPTTARRRRRKPLDLQELAEAARTAQATANALPAGESQEFVLGDPARTPAPSEAESTEAASAEAVSTEAEAAPPSAPAPEPVPTPSPEPAASVEGLPFDVDDDPLAGFLADPEIEAVADALAADAPGDEAAGSVEIHASAPPSTPGGPPSEMGAPPNTLPSRPRAMPRPAQVGSLFEAVMPQPGASEGEAEAQGTPPPTRPARPSAGRTADPRRAEAPPGDDRPGPTINLRGPDAEAERRKRPTADLGPRPADISVDELVEEARALGQQADTGAPTTKPVPAPAPAAVKARSTVDLSGDADDEPLDDPPPLDHDDPEVHARKTINLRRAEPTPPGDEVLELDDDDVLEVADEEPAPVAVDVLDADVVEVIDDIGGMPLTPEGEALRARRELEEADTGVFTVVGDPVESRPSSAPPIVEPEAETVELPEARVDEVAAGESVGFESDAAGAPPEVDGPDASGSGEDAEADIDVGADVAVEEDTAALEAEPEAPPASDGDAEPEVEAAPADAGEAELEAEQEDDAEAAIEAASEAAAEPEPEAVQEDDAEPAVEAAKDADVEAEIEAAHDGDADAETEAASPDDAEPAVEAASPDDAEPTVEAASAHGVEAEIEAPSEDDAEPEAVAASEAEPEVEAPSEDAEPEAVAAPEAGPENDEAPEAGAEPASKAAPEAEPANHAASEAGAEADVETPIDAAPESEAEPMSEATPEAQPEIDAAPEAENEPTSEATPEALPEIAAAPEAEPETEAAPEAEADLEPASDASPEAEAEAESASAAVSDAEPEHDAVPEEDERAPDPSAPALSLDALLDEPDDEFSDLDLMLSPPPPPQPSVTLDAIEALDLDGAVDDGADFDLDLGLDLGPPPAAEAEAEEPVEEAVPENDAELPPPPGPDPEKMAEAVIALTSGDEAIAATAEEVLVAGGATALEPLFDIFPGPLVVDRYAVGDPVPVAQHGPVLRTICRIGAPAGRYLAERCAHLAPDVRYYAVYAFSAVRDPASVAAITPALTDKDPSVRAIACRVADSYRGDEIFGVLVAHLVNIVEKGRLADRRVAAEALGNLHAADGATPLIAMLGAPQPPLRDAAHKALVAIAHQDFGDDVWRWRTFFERSAARPRVEWLLDGLLSDQRPIRMAAFRELRRVTHQNYGYNPDAPPATRRASAERWVRWWQQTGRSKFGHYR